jgi:hypothetical protein
MLLFGSVVIFLYICFTLITKTNRTMEFDFKITTWERVTVSEKHEEKVLQGIKDGTITSAYQIFDIVDGAECKKLDDTDEQLSVEENGGSSTIEVLDGGDTIFTNGE